MRSWLLPSVLAAAVLVFLAPPIAHPLSYHDFADRRACLGLPNCLDTASNALFVLADIWRIYVLFGTKFRPVFIDASEWWLYALFFLAVVLTGFASAYYHITPGNALLVGDQAMALAVVGLCPVALLFDRGDHTVFALTGGLISGHALKHGVAALAAWFVAHHLYHRRRVLR